MTIESTTLITPDMKVAALLDAYPQLEDVLIELVPAFKTLRNPVLREAVAKATTLERAAGMAEIPVRDLVLELRSVVGQPTNRDDPTASPAPAACGCFHPSENQLVGVTIESETAKDGDEPPGWFREDRVSQTIDAAAMLASGQVPVGPVMKAAEALAESKILCVTIDFKPTPLIKMLEQKGHHTYCRQLGADRFELFASRRSGS